VSQNCNSIYSTEILTRDIQDAIILTTPMNERVRFVEIQRVRKRCEPHMEALSEGHSRGMFLKVTKRVENIGFPRYRD
jgi:hypothetical protein